MNLASSKSKLAALLGTTSLLTTLSAFAANAQGQQAQMMMSESVPEEIPENVLITGSLIHGAVAVGVPVTNLTPMDFAQTGAVKIGDLFRDIPAANVSSTSSATYSGGHLERETRVNLRGLDATGPRALMMIDGMRFPPQADGICAIDPSIIPAISLDHIDVLADGASATYGSDAISGVINVILRRNFDGAMTQVGFSHSTAGKLHYLASQLWGRTWDGGQITLSFEWYDDSKVTGTAHSNYVMDYTPWGFDDRRPIAASDPGTISTGAPSSATGTSCTNCYSVPRGAGTNFAGGIGPTAPFSGSTLDWSSFSTNTSFTGPNGTRNIQDPLKLGWEDAPQQRTGAVMTLDQRFTKDISFFAEAFYSNRRGELLDAPNQTPTNNVAISAIAVPTFNPYYPTNAPGGLRVAYNLGLERAPFTDFYELSQRYAFGLNIDLPAGWHGSIHYSESSDANYLSSPNALNRNAVSAALGWTILPVAPSGSAPSFGTWTKPAGLPYLNLFCDPTEFLCNSQQTLTYVGGSRTFDEKMWTNEKAVNVDGPLFDLPGGTVRAALGASYISTNFRFVTLDNSGAPNLTMPVIIDAEPYQVWATYAQVNVPIFGDNNALPGFRRLDLEASWRHDQYTGTLAGGTSNPKIAMTWMLSEDAGLSIKGSWGTSFRFANAGEYSPIASTAIQAFNLPNTLAPATPSIITLNCAGGSPTPGSGAAKVFSATWGCGSTPFGLSLAGAPFLFLRPPGIRSENFQLKPEQSTNWSGGFDFAPSAFLKGLDVQATYYIIRIAGVLSAFNNQTSSNFNSSAEGFHWIVPSDLQAMDPACNAAANQNPSVCPEFENMVFQILTNSRNAAASPQAQTTIYYINDGGTTNNGVRKVDGFDWSASYDWDMGNLGAFNTGMVGTYYLHDLTISNPLQPGVDRYHQTLASTGSVGQAGVGVLPRFNYRTRLGWSNGPWSLTGFMNYNSHYYHTQAGPPNVNGNFCVSSTFGAQAGGTFPCFNSNYNNLQPPWYSFDLSLGYDTGEDPTNDYLKHVAVNLVVQNILDKHPAFQYGPSNAGRSFAAFDILKSNEGRVVNILVTKTW